MALSQEGLVGEAPATTKVETISVAQFMKSQGFTSVVQVVRMNSNQYPYITFVNASNEATNIYFSKKAATKVVEGEVVTPAFLKGFVATETSNEAGEKRWKLASGESNRLSLEDILALEEAGA